MNKIQTSLFITATKVDIKDNKIVTVEGEFYFQGKKYEIHNSEITTENKNTDTIPF